MSVLNRANLYSISTTYPFIHLCEASFITYHYFMVYGFAVILSLAVKYDRFRKGDEGNWQRYRSNIHNCLLLWILLQRLFTFTLMHVSGIILDRRSSLRWKDINIHAHTRAKSDESKRNVTRGVSRTFMLIINQWIIWYAILDLNFILVILSITTDFILLTIRKLFK